MVWIASAGNRIGNPADRARRGRLRHAALHQAHVGAGAAHVERDRVAEAARDRDHRGRGAHPGGRTGEQQPRRMLGRVDERHEPAGRRHHQHVVGERRPPARGTREHTARSAASATVVTIRSYSRNSGDTSCEHDHVDPAGAQRRRPPRARGHRIEIGVEQTHRDRVDVVERSGTSAIERLDLAAGGVEPPGHLEPQLAGHEGRRAVDARVVERRARLPRDLDHVGEAPRRHQRHPAQAPLAAARWSPPWCRGRGRSGAKCPRTRRPPRRDGSAGVDGTLRTAPSSVTTSVNVPPVSTPSLALPGTAPDATDGGAAAVARRSGPATRRRSVRAPGGGTRGRARCGPRARGSRCAAAGGACARRVHCGWGSRPATRDARACPARPLR